MLVEAYGVVWALALVFLSVLFGPYVIERDSRLAGPESQPLAGGRKVVYIHKVTGQPLEKSFYLPWYTNGNEVQTDSTQKDEELEFSLLDVPGLVWFGSQCEAFYASGWLNVVAAVVAAVTVSLVIAYLSLTKLDLFKKDMHDDYDQQAEVIALLKEDKPPVPPVEAEKSEAERAPRCKFGNLDIRDIISEGQFGTVYRARDINTREFCIVKEVDKFAVNKLHANKFAADHYRQLEILEAVQECIYCAKMTTCMETKEFLYIVMPTLGRDMSWLMYHCQGHVDELVLCLIAAQLSCALEFIHNKGIIHCYVTPDNIYLSENIHAYLGNFSRSVTCNTSKKGRWGYIGSYPYTAPEIPCGDSYDGGIDWWSLGVINYLAMFGKPPFSKDGDDDIAKIQAQLMNEDPVFPKGGRVSAEAVEFIDKMLIKNPDERLGSVHSPHGSVFDQRFFKSNHMYFVESNGSIIVSPASIPPALKIPGQFKLSQLPFGRPV